MQPRFLSLLVGLLAALFVNALPVTFPPRGLVTLPLKRLQQRSDVHPLIAHQQQINRSQRRLARMSGGAEPSTEELTENLRKRLVAIDDSEVLEKRYSRFGVPKKQKSKSKSKAKAGTLANAAAGKSKKKGGKGAASANTLAAGDALGGPVSGNDVTAADQPTADNSLGLNVEGNDVGYLATVQMGTPPRPFLILMDSGSADLWVGGEKCKSQAGGGCGQHQFLGGQSSQSFQDTGKPFTVTYGSGEVAGNIVQDDISVAGLQLKGHTFGVANTESVEFSADTTPFDGLMGLAQSTLSNQKTPTPIEALAAAGLVPEAITSYKISRVADGKNDGEITFGGLDTSKFDPQTLVEVKNVNQQGFWEAAMGAVTVNGQNLGLDGRTAILDTGTTLIIAPAEDATAIHTAIPGAQADGQGGFTVPCNTKATLALSFGGTSFAIDSRDLAFQPVDPNNPNGDCISGIAAGNIGGPTEWLVGDVFLKNAYFSTNVNKNTLSLAKLV